MLISAVTLRLFREVDEGTTSDVADSDDAPIADDLAAAPQRDV